MEAIREQSVAEISIFQIPTGVLQEDVLALFLFITVIDYVSSLSEGNFGYITYKAIVRTSLRAARSTLTVVASVFERKLSELAFADDVALLENSITQAQDQRNEFKNSVATVGLILNAGKTKQMQNQLQGANTI